MFKFTFKLLLLFERRTAKLYSKVCVCSFDVSQSWPFLDDFHSYLLPLFASRFPFNFHWGLKSSFAYLYAEIFIGLFHSATAYAHISLFLVDSDLLHSWVLKYFSFIQHKMYSLIKQMLLHFSQGFRTNPALVFFLFHSHTFRRLFGAR